MIAIAIAVGCLILFTVYILIMGKEERPKREIYLAWDAEKGVDK